ncbi:MAG: hypothetical protein EBR82_78845 [Caulobacteraceae bacterium]|nr:hypothetical protein [Caulobacteraceae bacterium]
MPTKTMIHAVKFRDVKSNQPQKFAISWQGLSSLLQISEARSDKTQRELWSPVTYLHGTTRGNCNVEYVTCLVVDMDGEAFDHARLDGLEYVAYTTWSHTPEDQHWHLVLPLAYPVPADRWHEVWTRLHERINVVGDPQTKDPARIFYRPQHKPLTIPDIKIGFGEFIDPQLEERFIARPVVRRNLRTTETKKKRYWEDEAWWNEPQDLSRFNGMTKPQIAAVLRTEFAELRKTLNLD